MRLLDYLPAVRDLRSALAKERKTRERVERELVAMDRLLTGYRNDLAEVRRELIENHAARQLRAVSLGMLAVLFLGVALCAAYAWGHRVGEQDAASAVQATAAPATPVAPYGSPMDRNVQKSFGSTKRVRYSWPAAAGASGYRVSFVPVSGSSPITRVVRNTFLSIGLPYGEYRWYVWAMHGKKVAARATIASSLTLP